MVRCLRRRGRAAGEVLPSSPPISPISPPVRPLLEKQSQEERGSIAATPIASPGGSSETAKERDSPPARSSGGRMAAFRDEMQAASAEMELKEAAAKGERHAAASSAASSAEAAEAFTADIARVKSNDKSLLDLCWRDRGVTTAQLELLAQVLPGNTHLLTIDLSWNSLTGADMRPLVVKLCACSVAAVNISATPAAHDLATRTALQELCAPRYLKLLLYNHPSLHTLEVPSVFHERFGDEEADRLADALKHNDHLLHILAGHAGAELTEVGISHLEGAIARSPGHATVVHQGHLRINVLGSSKMHTRGGAMDVPVSSRVRRADDPIPWSLSDHG